MWNVIERSGGKKRKREKERLDRRKEAESPVRGQGRMMSCMCSIFCTCPIVAFVTRNSPIFFALTETMRNLHVTQLEIIRKI